MLLFSLAISASMMCGVMAQEMTNVVSVANNGLSYQKTLIRDNQKVAKIAVSPVDKVYKSVGMTSKFAGLGNKLTTKSAPATEVGDMMVSYKNPTCLYLSTSDEGYSYSGTIYMMPAYVDLTWENTSVGAASYQWKYLKPNALQITDPSEDFYMTSTTEDLTVNYPWLQDMVVNGHVLTATDETGKTGEYSDGNCGIVLGGHIVDAEAGTFFASVCDMYDVYIDNVEIEDPETGELIEVPVPARLSGPEYGIGEEGDNFYNQQLFYGMADVKVLGFGNVHPKQISPYAISKVSAVISGEWTAGAVLKTTVYSISNESELLPLATGECTMDEASEDGYVYFVDFDLQHELFPGFYQKGYITIDSDVYIEISTDDSKVTSLSPVYYMPSLESNKWGTLVGSGAEAGIDAPNADAYSYSRISASMSGETSEGLIGAYNFFSSLSMPELEGKYFNAGAFIIDVDAVFGWLNDGGEGLGTTVSVPAEGGDSEGYPLWTYYEFNESVYVENDEDNDNVIDGADWLSYNLVQPTIGTGEYEGYFLYGDIVFTAEPLPAGETSRYAKVKLIATGAAPLELIVSQGATGINTVVAESAAKVAVVGGNFVVTAPEGIDAVTVYNVAGQAVAASEVAGTTTVDAQSLAKGVYILRFNDGSTVKVMK